EHTIAEHLQTVREGLDAFAAHRARGVDNEDAGTTGFRIVGELQTGFEQIFAPVGAVRRIRAGWNSHYAALPPQPTIVVPSAGPSIRAFFGRRTSSGTDRRVFTSRLSRGRRGLPPPGTASGLPQRQDTRECRLLLGWRYRESSEARPSAPGWTPERP